MALAKSPKKSRAAAAATCRPNKVEKDDENARLRTQGHLRRYIVKHADGAPTHPQADYFVLRLDSHGSCPEHVHACRIAVRAYAQAINAWNPVLSDELLRAYPNRFWRKPKDGKK